MPKKSWEILKEFCKKCENNELCISLLDITSCLVDHALEKDKQRTEIPYKKLHKPK